jgi:hypothetical protein
VSLKGIFALTIGLVLLWVGWNNWKQRDSDAIPWIEDRILAASGEEPLPRTRFDRISRRVQAGLGLALGLFFGFLGFVLIFDLGD